MAGRGKQHKFTLPCDIADKIDDQIKKGKYSDRPDFHFRAALLLLNWDLLQNLLHLLPFDLFSDPEFMKQFQKLIEDYRREKGRK